MLRMDLRSDNLNEIGVLRRREIEARIVAPIVEALGKEFGHERVRAIVRDVIVEIAREQGAQLARQAGGNALTDFAATREVWLRGGALELDTIEQTDTTYSFNVTGCRYAEMYRALGIPELGAVLSCNRDAAAIEGFNSKATLARTQTTMGGAPCCDFRYSYSGAERETTDDLG
jgi:hypothetical protein